MPFCSVRGCRNKSGHLFPRNNPILKRKWMKFAGLSEKEINPHSLICKIHFDEDQFDEHEFIEGLPPPRKRLKRNAVPTLHPNLERGTPVAPRKVRKQKVYDLPCPQRSNEIAVGEIDLFRTPLLSEKQLATVIERIKLKLIKNTHPSSVFPRDWETSSLLEGKHKIREGYPPFSMPCLVSLAIESNPRRVATPPEIVGFISHNFPGYKLSDTSWHGKVLETLETFTLFQKVPSSFSENPKKIFFKFAPGRKKIITPEVYEAFTDPHYDDSLLDLNSQEIQSITTEDIVDSCIGDLNEDFELTDLEENVNPADDSSSIASHLLTSVSFEEDANVNENQISTPENDEEKTTTAGVEEEEEEEELSNSSGDESIVFIECSYCQFLAVTPKTISSHVAQKHWNGSEYCCSLCNFVSSSKENLMAHKPTHKKFELPCVMR